MRSIYDKCANLDRLNINPPNGVLGQEFHTFYREFYKSEFFTNSPKCKSTLKYLTLNQFKARESKAEYFKNFDILKSIKYPKQFKGDFNSTEEAKIINDLWPCYKLLLTGINVSYGASYDVEFKRV